MRLLCCALTIGILRRPAQFVAKILQMRELTYKFRTDGPKLFSPDFLIVPSVTNKLSQNGSENSDKSTTQSKPRG